MVVEAARALARSGLVVGSVGNVSVRDRELIYITPTRMAYETLRPRDVAVCTIAGDVIGGNRAPSVECPVHLAVYRARPDAGAIVHTHSLYATTWSFLGAPLGAVLSEQHYYGITEVPVIAPLTPGSSELAAAAAATATGADAMLLARHGVLTLAVDPYTALVRAQVVERTAAAVTTLCCLSHRVDAQQWSITTQETR